MVVAAAVRARAATAGWWGRCRRPMALVPLSLALASASPGLANGPQDLDRCHQAYTAGAPDVAIGLCSRALKDQGLPTKSRAMAHLLRGVATCGCKDGLPDFEAAAAIDPELGLARLWLGYAYGQVGRHDDALRDLSAGLKQAPREPMGWLWRGQVFAAVGRPADALRDAERAVALSPNWSEAWFFKGSMEARLGQLDRALDGFSRSLKLAPTNAKSFARRAALHAERGDLKAARADADAAVKFDADEPRHLLDRGRIALLAGDDKAAIADMTVALRRMEDRNARLYGAIWLSIAVLRSGTELQHLPNVLTFAEGDPGDWPAPIARLYLTALARVKADWKEKMGDPAGALAQARRGATEPNRTPFEDRACETHFFLGVYHVLTNDVAAGAELLRRAAAQRRDSWCHIGAKAELARLTQHQAKGASR